MEATVDSNATDYNKATDPAVLAVAMEANAQEVQEEGGSLYRNQVIGIGEIACVGTNGAVYLTSEGAQLSLDYPG